MGSLSLHWGDIGVGEVCDGLDADREVWRGGWGRQTLTPLGGPNGSPPPPPSPKPETPTKVTGFTVKSFYFDRFTLPVFMSLKL